MSGTLFAIFQDRICSLKIKISSHEEQLDYLFKGGETPITLSILRSKIDDLIASRTTLERHVAIMKREGDT